MIEQLKKRLTDMKAEYERAAVECVSGDTHGKYFYAGVISGLNLGISALAELTEKPKDPTENVLKRYALFAGGAYYPAGGWWDFKGTYETLDDAEKAVIRAAPVDWWHVVDLVTGEVVKTS